jgi:hypothetical protein
MAVPDFAKAKPAAPPAPTPAKPAPAPEPTEDAATVLMKAPADLSAPPPAKPAAPPADADADMPTIMVKSAQMPIPAAPPAPAPAAPPEDATRQMPVMAPKAAAPAPAAKGKAEPPKPAPKPAPAKPAPAPAKPVAAAAPASPHTEPVARPAELAAAPAAKASKPAAGAKSGGGAGKLIAIGLVGLVFVLGALVVVALLIKSHLDAGNKPVTVNTPAPSTPAPATPVPVANTPATPPPTLVHITSDPAKATIFVDGNAKGLTPLDVSDLALGTHEIRIELDGYEAKTESVELTGSVTEATVNVALSKPAPTMGTADITSTPSGAAITLDGKPFGTTPRKGVSLKPGTYRLELRLAGHDAYAGNLEVTLGKRARVAAALKAEVKATPSPEPTKDVVDPKRTYEEADVDVKPKRVSGPSSPTYPGSLKSGEAVSVVVTWVVTENGEIVEPKIVESGGKKIDDAVLQMLAKQKYEAGSKKGTNVKVRLTRKYSFRSG